MNTPVPHLFTQLEGHPAWKRFCEEVEKMIEIEELKYWDFEDENTESRIQRMRVKHFKEFWIDQKTMIKNAQSMEGK